MPDTCNVVTIGIKRNMPKNQTAGKNRRGPVPRPPARRRPQTRRTHILNNIPGPVPMGVGATGTNASVGALRVRNKEYWFTLSVPDKAGIKTVGFTPGGSGMTVLDGLGLIYDNYRVNRAQVFLVGTAPTTSPSIANCCIDYEPGLAPKTQDNVLRTVPNVTLPLYRNASLVANKTSMMRRNWFITTSGAAAEQNTVFLLSSWLTGTAAESILVYCDYDVEFRNPQKGS